jgi:DDE family transposase
MTASLETLVIAAYIFADAAAIPRRGAAGETTDAELIALAVAQAAIGVPSDRQFLGLIERVLPGWFPKLPSQPQYNRRLRRLTPVITAVQLHLAALVAEGRLRLADGTLIACANYPGCAGKSEFAGHAGYGYCPSKSQFVWGMRLVLVSDHKGVPVGYDLVDPKVGRERESVRDLATAHPGSLLFCDGGFWGAGYRHELELLTVELVTPKRHTPGERPPTEIAKARIRLVIESLFSNLKQQMRLEQHLAKTLPGLAQRIAQRLLALTLGIYLNPLTGRPARALVAYDGR